MTIILKKITKLMHEELYDFIEKHRGELVLDFWEVVRLEEIVYDDQDIYYVYRKRKNGVHYSSCVGGPILLKGNIPDKDYKQLEEVFFINCNTAHSESKTYIDWKQVVGFQFNLKREWELYQK